MDPLLILAGGFGTRLSSILGEKPKVMADINGINFLSIQMYAWKAQGIRTFIFLLHHKAAEIIEFLTLEMNKSLKGCSVEWVVEDAPLLTGGAVKNAIDKLKISGNFFLTNADTWLSGGISVLSKAKVPSIGVVNVIDTSRYGEIIFDKDNVVTFFSEKNGEHNRGWINSGLLFLNSNLFSKFRLECFSLEEHFLPALVANKQLNVVKLQYDFFDIGTPDDYKKFLFFFENSLKRYL
jgi:D-glycero-alpha-D-manno-heptose 1-phosphate guanylyltransferase